MKFTSRYLQAINSRSLPSGVTAIFYDWDGTLRKFHGTQFLDSMNKALTMFGYPEIKSLKQSKSVRDSFSQIINCPEKEEQALEAFRDSFSEYPISKDILMPGAEELFESARAHGLPQAIVSNLDQKLLSRQIESLGIGSYFAAIIGSRNDKHLKPNPTLLIEACDTVNIARNKSILYLGDTTVDIDAANKAKCTSVFVGNHQPETKPDLWVRNLSEIREMIDKAINNPSRSL
jgi:HAD superfamily hydrolase (TIGR01549 family)